MNEQQHIVAVQIKSVYGNERIYPRNDQAQRLADLAGKRTLDRQDIALIKAMGFQIEVVSEVNAL